MSNHEPAECHAFRRCFAILADGITNPGQLAVQLYSRELIGPDLLKEAQKQAIEERVKTVNILLAVQDKILTSPATNFREFLDVLQNDTSLHHLAARLENAHRELVRIPPFMSTPPSPLPSSVDDTSPLPLPSAKRPRTDNDLQSHPVSFGTHHPLPAKSQNFGRIPTGTLHAVYTPCCQLFAFATYASYLKSVYTREKLPIYDKWPQVKSKKFINLALIDKESITKPEAVQFMRATIHGNVDDIRKSKQAMSIGQIAQLPDGSQPKCILVEGAPGVGKSTFAWKICHKWGKGKLLWQYQLVVLLRLRDKSVRAAVKISDLFHYHNHQIQQAAVEEIQDTGGKGVLLLFEGYDELPEELRTENSIFIDIITGRKLPEATVLITSRPWANEFLHRECKNRISQHIEILGFTKADIQSYLESTTANDPSLLVGLKKYISCYPHIGSLMYIPLNSAFVVEVYRNNRNNKTLVPKTTTELYFSLIRDLLRCKWKIHSFSELPQDVYQQLCKLGRIAHKGIINKQQVIFSDLPEGFETLGLMQCVPELYAGEDAMVSYNFLHLTVQEYLAAFHLSQQPVEEQIELYKQYCSEEDKQVNNDFKMVLWFLSGIKKFSEYPCEVMNTLCLKKHIGHFDIESGSDYIVEARDEPIHEITFDTLHWLFEAQDSDVINKLLGSSDIQLHAPNYIVTPFDCFVLGYCVSHSNCTWRINLSECDIGDEGVEMLVRGILEEETGCTGRISTIKLMGGDITAKAIKHLVSIPKQLINKLKIFSLEDENIDHSIGPGGAVPLIRSLTGNISLEELRLYGVGIGIEDCHALCELLSSSTSLKHLDISLNDLPPEAVEFIITGLYHNTTLKRLEMYGSHFSIQHMISLSFVLRKNHTLVSLDLGNCNIDSDGAYQLANGLCTNDTLQELNLYDNPIEAVGAAVFAEMLRTNHTIVKLHLYECNIDSDGACQLASALCTNSTLRDLHLGYNPIRFEGAAAFADMLKTNHTLVKLCLSRCNIESDGACQLASALCKNNTLQELWLSGNLIEVKGATALAEMLLKNNSLKVLHLHLDHSIGEEGTLKLIESLRHNTTMKELWLNGKYKSFFEVDSRVTFL